MGNQLVAFAPSLIRPVEHYLTDVPELVFDMNLGSTRFLKVCRAKQGQLLCVVKVFVVHEHTVPIQVYCERLLNLRNSLSSSPSPNCLPFTQAKCTERSVVVIRPYVKYSLYDRMSTRPFIQWSEKLWIAFQLLCGLAQVHKHGLSHGDLKLENILITPGLRLLLCDFAPFKPVYLPRNNPSAIFGFFFDTAGRRCCYVAPERFHDDKSRLGADNLLTQEDELKHFLLPSMDIFSAGCCLIELFTEGRVPFDLSQLLSFCAGEYDPEPVIRQIEDPNARELVAHMIQRDPTSRETAENYLSNFKGRLFPPDFYITLQSYYDILAFQPLVKADSRMSRLWQDISRNTADGPLLSLIFTSLVTAEVRGLNTVTAKLYALESFKILSTKLGEECILERVVPYITYLLQDPSPRVRAEAITTLVDCLDMVKNVPPSDYNIFSSYIFPALDKLDRDVAVKISLAKNIARLAEISKRYLETSFLHETETLNQPQLQFSSEFHSQRETIASFLALILTDSDPVVKRVLVATPGSLETLCVYFEREKAHDVILSHLITFLNDKEDSQLRVAFFRCVSGVAAFIGWHAAPLLIPLLKQGLSDAEEFVMRAALLTIKTLAEINFFGRRFLLDLLEETLPFVIHPNLWLRMASVGVITSIKNNLAQVDVHCHVIPRLRAYLKPSTGALWGVNEVSILSKVKDPLERQVYESCAKARCNLLGFTIKFLRNNDKGMEPDSNEVANFITRLRAEGLFNPLDQVYIYFLQKHLVKVNTQRSLRLATVAIASFPSVSTKGTYDQICQKPLQSNLLNMSLPHVKDIVGSQSTLTLSDNSTTQTSPRPSSPSFGYMNRFTRVIDTQQHLATFTEKPRGILVAHLHEHRCSVTKICPLTTFRGLFATAAREDVRIWDAEKMEGRNVANRSRCVIRLPGEKNVTNMAYAVGANVIGVTDDRELYGFSLENMVARNIFTLPINNQFNDVGVPVALESCSPYLFIVGTEMGALLGFDTRAANKEIFHIQSDLKWGLLTSLSSNEDRDWMCTATSKGILTCWDLRFSIPVTTIKTGSPVRKMKSSIFHSWGVFTSSRSQNEVSLWNLETGSRHLCLWANSSPPLSQPPEPTNPANSRPSHSIFGMSLVRSNDAVITAGSDMAVRWWDLNSPNDSYMLINPEKAEQQITGGSPKNGEYRFRLVDGVEVIYELGSSNSSSSHSHGRGGTSIETEQGIGTQSSTAGSSGTAHSIVMGNAHHNNITDVATVATPNQSFILTSSSDGVIKVWK